MTPNASEILNDNVVQIGNFQSTLSPHINLWWGADFSLASGQKFHVRWNDKGYLFTPASKHNLLPELEEILWSPEKTGFGGRGCGYRTEIKLAEGSTTADQEAYKKILTPQEIDEGRWVPYPSYRYAPMLMTAFGIRYAYARKIKIEKIVQKANRNLADVLALRDTTYDLRQYD